MKLIFADEAWEDYLYWQKQDRKMVERINKLIREIQRNPFEGKIIFKSMQVGNKCEMLNVRRLASLESDVIRTLAKGSVVNVNLEKSTDDFYYVASEIIDSEHKTPIHGYCKKDFLFE